MSTQIGETEKLDADKAGLLEKNGKFKVTSFYAKKARGLMSRRFIVKNRPQPKPEQLTGFNSEGYFSTRRRQGKRAGV